MVAGFEGASACAERKAGRGGVGCTAGLDVWKERKIRCTCRNGCTIDMQCSTTLST